jgi:F0F1-type ATP synthase membrane subunit b/b'
MHMILNAMHQTMLDRACRIAGGLLDCERALQQLQAHIQQLTLAVRQAAEKSTPDEYRDR